MKLFETNERMQLGYSVYQVIRDQNGEHVMSKWVGSADNYTERERFFKEGEVSYAKPAPIIGLVEGEKDK